MSYQVVHATQGRLRMRVPQLSWDAKFAHRLQQSVEALQFITAVRINPAASSLIVAYVPVAIDSLALQERLFVCIEQASMTQRVATPVHFTDAVADATDRANWESESEAELPPETDWQRLGLPLLSLGLALLATPWEFPPPAGRCCDRWGGPALV